jgi:hypothetical protein
VRPRGDADHSICGDLAYTAQVKVSGFWVGRPGGSGGRDPSHATAGPNHCALVSSCYVTIYRRERGWKGWYGLCVVVQNVPVEAT